MLLPEEPARHGSASLVEVYALHPAVMPRASSVDPATVVTTMAAGSGKGAGAGAGDASPPDCPTAANLAITARGYRQRERRDEELIARQTRWSSRCRRKSSAGRGPGLGCHKPEHATSKGVVRAQDVTCGKEK